MRKRHSATAARHLDVLRGHSDHLGATGQTGSRPDRPDRPDGHASRLASSPASCSAFPTWPPAELTLGPFITRSKLVTYREVMMADASCPSGSAQSPGPGAPGRGLHAPWNPRPLSLRALTGGAAIAGPGAAIADPAVASARKVSGPRQADPGESFSPATGRILQEIIASGWGASNAPGLNVGIWVPGRGSYVQALGVSDLATGTPLQPDDHFRIGSVTKTFTATAILQLMDEHKISLDEQTGTLRCRHPRR